MSSTNKTTYYELPQFVDSDLFNPLVDDNDAYSKIDTALHNIADAEANDASEIVAVKGRVTTAEGKIEALESQNGVEVLTTTAQTLSGAINELDGDVASLDGRLDVVEDDINNENIGLKVKVDNLGTRMTSAEGDIDALETLTGSGTLDTVAQTLVGAVNENFDKIATYGTIYTPEMFGAVGDGVADDTTAVQSAINTGICCVLNKTYKTTAPISIGSHKFVVLNGTINYTGNDCALALSNDPYIVGTGAVTSAGNAVISNKSLPLRFAVVEGLILICETADANIIHLESSSSDNSVSNNRFVRLELSDNGNAEAPVAESGIYLHSTDSGYINENRFEQIHFKGTDFAIKMVIDGSNNMNRDHFVQITSENSAHSLYAKSNTADAHFYQLLYDFRTLEFSGRNEIIQIDHHMLQSKFYGSYAPYMFKCLDEVTAHNIYAPVTPNSNIIIGKLTYNDQTKSMTYAEFSSAYGKIFFDFNYVGRSANLGGVDGVVTLDYSGSNTHPAGFKILRIGSALTELTIDLNDCSTIYFSPLKFLHVQNSAGTDITIVNGSQEIMARTHLTEGYHEMLFITGSEIIPLN